MRHSGGVDEEADEADREGAVQRGPLPETQEREHVLQWEWGERMRSRVHRRGGRGRLGGEAQQPRGEDVPERKETVKSIVFLANQREKRLLLTKEVQNVKAR